MNKRNKTKETSAGCPDYMARLPKSLADLLHQKADDRFPKYEAFRYLLEKHSIANRGNNAGELSPFTITVTQMAKDWLWHRHTVSSFLQDLVNLKVLTVEKVSGGCLICFTRHIIPFVE